MNITLSVLWFDDREDYFASLTGDIDWLKSKISSWGFIPNIILVSTPEKFNEHFPFTSIDLIVVDWKLEGYEDGQVFIANIRNNSIYTEVILYTTNNASDLWQTIYDKRLEGVFVANRNNIIEKIAKVGYQSIRKVVDLENMRGIMMAELGELDHILDDIFREGMRSLPSPEQDVIYKKFHKQLLQQSQRTVKQLEALNENPQIDTIINLSDSYKRWVNFQRLSESHAKMKELGPIGNFEVEILKPRNSLAHGKPEIKDGVYIFRYQDTEYYFDHDVSIELRKTIIAYKKQFYEILNALKLLA